MRHKKSLWVADRVNRRLNGRTIGCLGVISVILSLTVSASAEQLVIAASPSVSVPLEAISHLFESAHPDVQVRLWLDSGLDLRRTIAAMHNSEQSLFQGASVHLVAPGGDELLDRLESKAYVSPGTRHVYAAVPLVLVVPAALVDAPDSFESLKSLRNLRVAVADPMVTELGRRTERLLRNLGLDEALSGHLDLSLDGTGVLDHMLSGQADLGILFGPDAVEQRERVRIVATSPNVDDPAAQHSIAMVRLSPNRALSRRFMQFAQTLEVQMALQQLGYLPMASSHEPTCQGTQCR